MDYYWAYTSYSKRIVLFWVSFLQYLPQALPNWEEMSSCQFFHVLLATFNTDFTRCNQISKIGGTGLINLAKCRNKMNKVNSEKRKGRPFN